MIREESVPRTVDQLLAGDPFEVNRFACFMAAKRIAKYRPTVDALPWGHLALDVQLTFKIAFIAICHQINWDYLQVRLADQLLEDGGQSLINTLASTTAKDVKEWLRSYRRPERIRASERAAFLRDIGKILARDFESDPTQLLARANKQKGGPGGFVDQLDAFAAYRADPLRKKSFVLIQDLVRERLVTFRDDKEIKPAIDYHVIRIYLRTGRVVPVFPEIADILKGRPRPRPRLVKLLRARVAEALDLTAFYAHLPVADVNYVEWQLGRSLCEKEEPRCITGVIDQHQDRDIANLCRGACPYAEFCAAYNNEEWRELQEPDFARSFY